MTRTAKNTILIRNRQVSFCFYLAIFLSVFCESGFSYAADLLSPVTGATITYIDTEHNSTNWAAANLTDGDSETNWLSNRNNNDIIWRLDSGTSLSYFDSFTLENYGNSRSIQKFMLFRAVDVDLDDDVDGEGWIPIPAEPSPTGPINSLLWGQGGRLVAIDSQYNSTGWAAAHLNDGSLNNFWLSNKATNTLEYRFDTNWDGDVGDGINLSQIRLYNYGGGRSIQLFQVEVQTVANPGVWNKLVIPDSSVGTPDFNFLLNAEGGNLVGVDSQYNTTSLAAAHINDGDYNSIWLSNKRNNSLEFEFDTDGDGVSGFAGDSDDRFSVEKFYLRNYGDNRSIQLFQVEIQSAADPGVWVKLEAPGSGSGTGISDFNYLLDAEGGALVGIDSQYNATNWAAAHINDGDYNSIWLSSKGNNTLEFEFDTDGDGVTGANNDVNDLLTIESVYVRNYGNSRSVKLFQIEVETTAGPTSWVKLEVPGSGAGESDFNFALSHESGRLFHIDDQSNTTSWAASHMHDGDINTLWLSNKEINDLDFAFDTDGDGFVGDRIDLSKIRLRNYGSSRSVQTFEIYVQISESDWQIVSSPSGGTIFTALESSALQEWDISQLSDVTAVRFHTLSNFGDSYIGAREIELLGVSVGPSHTFVAQRESTGEFFRLPPSDRPDNVTSVRFHTISNYGDSYTGAREFEVLGTMMGASHTFTAQRASSGEYFDLDADDRPSDVTALRFITLRNYGDSYIGAREFEVLGSSIGSNHTFMAGSDTGPHDYDLGSAGQQEGVVGVRFITLRNYGDSYTGARELELLGDPVGPDYIFTADRASTLQQFDFGGVSGRLFRLHTLRNYGDSYIGAREITLQSSNVQSAEYRFDVCSETDIIIDDSGNGFDGHVQNGPLAIEVGKICNGGRFDGTDDYVEIDDSNKFDNTAALTIAGWIKPEDIRIPPPTGNARGIISKRNTFTSAVAYGVFFYSARGDGKIYVDLDTTNNRFASNSVIPEDTWTHFAVVFDGSLPVTQRAKLYVNGRLDKVAPETSAFIPDYNSNLYIGNLYTGPSQLKVYKGMLDEIRVIPAALSAANIQALYNETRSGCQVCAAVDHFRIEHTGTGLTCQPSSVEIRACADSTCSSEFSDPVTVTLTPATSNPPTWIGGDTQTFTGHQTFQLRQTTPILLTLGLTNLNPAPTNGYECYDSGVEGDCDIIFYDSGFVFDVPDLTSCETSPTVSIHAVRKDDTAQTCVAADGFSSTTKTVNLWSTYVNPVTGSSQVSLGGTTIATSPPGTEISLDFDASATANFNVNYPDAGQIQLDARYETVVDGSTLVMLGTDSFVARPVGLCLYSDDSGSYCVAANGSCSAFRKVDESFNLKLRGVCWESSGDADFCTGNSTTPNFQLSSIPITHNLVVPTSAGISSGNIGVTSVDISAADNGEHIIGNQTVSEVGVFTFTATPLDYFGSPLPSATSENIGRFTPDHFVASITDDGVFQDACSGFSYSGQMFGYASPNFPKMLITAVGTVGNTTVNYRDDFIKLTDPATQITMPDVTDDSSHAGALATPLALTWSPAASSLLPNNNGTLDFALGTDQFTYTRDANALVAPFTTDVQLSITAVSDSDGVTATGLPTHFSPTGTEIRYGQMQLQNAYGPETLPLVIPVLTEYYDGSHFIPNSLDSCTGYNFINLTLSNYQGNLAAGDTIASGSGTLLSGIGNNLGLSAPGVGHDGSVDLVYDLDAAGLEWLQPGGNNPTAKVTFGIFKGNNHLIYMRESIW